MTNVWQPSTRTRRENLGTLFGLEVWMEGPETLWENPEAWEHQIHQCEAYLNLLEKIYQQSTT